MPQEKRLADETTIIELLTAYFELRRVRKLNNVDFALSRVWILGAGGEGFKAIGYKNVIYIMKAQIQKGFELGGATPISWRQEQAKGLLSRADIPEDLKLWLKETGVDWSKTGEVALDTPIDSMLNAWKKLA